MVIVMARYKTRISGEPKGEISHVPTQAINLIYRGRRGKSS